MITMMKKMSLSIAARPDPGRRPREDTLRKQLTEPHHRSIAHRATIQIEDRIDSACTMDMKWINDDRALYLIA